ncbi:MAG: hypothetical protein JW929_09600 [Anaerolineales bacterium]|nr:hypothetical protein [Anaerolineales bacterium]
MNPRAPQDARLLEHLSAFLDGKLTVAEQSTLEERLERDADLREQLESLRAVREVLRSLPPQAPPRPLTLSPAQAGTAPRRTASLSPRWMSLGSAFAALALVVVVLTDVSSTRSTLNAAAPEAPQMLFAVPGENRTADDAAAEWAGEDAAPAAAEESASPPPAATRSGTQEKSAGIGAAAERTEPPAPTSTQALDVCEAQSGTDGALDPCGPTVAFTPPPVRVSFSRVGFRSIAPYLETALALTAVILGALAMVLRKRK